MSKKEKNKLPEESLKSLSTFSCLNDKQKELKNFPNFGDKCSEYDIIILQNMANLAYISDDGLAKYMLGARIDYKEE